MTSCRSSLAEGVHTGGMVMVSAMSTLCPVLHVCLDCISHPS